MCFKPNVLISGMLLSETANFNINLESIPLKLGGGGIISINILFNFVGTCVHIQDEQKVKQKY